MTEAYSHSNHMCNARAQMRELSAYRSKGLCCSPGILRCLLPGLLQRPALDFRRQVKLQKENSTVMQLSTSYSLALLLANAIMAGGTRSADGVTVLAFADFGQPSRLAMMQQLATLQTKHNNVVTLQLTVQIKINLPEDSNGLYAVQHKFNPYHSCVICAILIHDSISKAL